MRSSIACARCRRSKTKCDNNGARDPDGGLAPCKSCAASDRKCEYPAPSPATNNSSQRRESTATAAGDEAPLKKRKRPVVPTTTGTPSRSRGKLGTHDDALDSPLLTPKIWEELWAIYEKHYAIEFPFLHKRTFLGPLQRLPPVSSSETGPNLQSLRSHDPALVLAFLALTSPFHAELVAQTSSPYDTAEFYATACDKFLVCNWNKVGDSAMQLVQALLMLGYHEWTGGHSRNGYMRIFQAVGFARTNGYHNDIDMSKRGEGSEAVSKRDRFIQEESKRRTFWSCFIMDRYFSVGKNRPRIIHLEDFDGKIQIPCSDKNFISGRAVKTRFFGETDMQFASRRKKLEDESMLRKTGQKIEKIEWEDREDDGMIGRYIYALDHFSDVNKWANKGGRRSEPANIGPWNPETQYYHLDKRLRENQEDLPEELRLSSVNTENHIYAPPSTTSRIYFMLHAVLMLSTSYLAPEYLPTYGFRQTKPEGPRDAPLVTEDLPEDQPDYWVVKAKECFEYVRDFVSMLQSFKERDLVVESPFMGHAFWRAAWAAMYCHYVPAMDPSKALNSKLDPNAWDTTNLVLVSMKKKFRISNIHSADLATVAGMYAEARRDYRAVGGSPQSTASDSDGGLQEYSAKMEVAHKQWGSLEIDGKLFKLPVDTLYRKLEELESEEESENVATPHSPAVTFKSECEEPRRSASIATSANSTFTPVNRNNNTVPASKESTSVNVETANSIQAPRGPPASQASQPPQSFHDQPHQYGQTTTYGYSSASPTYVQPTPPYGFATPYAPTPGPTQAQVASSYDPQAILDLEHMSDRTLNARGVGFFDVYEFSRTHPGFYDVSYQVEQPQSQMPYMQDPQGNYMYSTPWSGSG